MVVASDGVWEKLENAEVAKIVARYAEAKDAQIASREVLNAARQKWINVNFYF